MPSSIAMARRASRSWRRSMADAEGCREVWLAVSDWRAGVSRLGAEVLMVDS